MGELADRLTYDEPVLAPRQAALAVGRWPAEAYAQWFATLPADARATVEDAWGPAPARCTSARGPSSSSAGSISEVCSWPSNPHVGLAKTPVALYHFTQTWRRRTTTSASTAGWRRAGGPRRRPRRQARHLRVAAGQERGALRVVLPRRRPRLAPARLPLRRQRPGRRNQAKRRGHAVIVDHLVPPLTRAEAYDHLAQLEVLLDTHAQVASSIRPSFPPSAARSGICWSRRRIHRDLGLGASDDDAAFDDPAFDDLLVEVDGYLCELKDAESAGGCTCSALRPEAPPSSTWWPPRPAATGSAPLVA